ncbi:MAG: element excision factor XisH family protein [Saprospiraceae bacterium]
MAKDVYHQHVKEALVKDGWTITHDPLPMLVDDERWEIDLGAEKILAAQRGDEKIAVEVKSFVSRSRAYEFHRAFGQYMIYFDALSEIDSDRVLYLAVPLDVYEAFLSRPFYQKLIVRRNLKLLIFNPELKEIVQWIK